MRYCFIKYLHREVLRVDSVSVRQICASRPKNVLKSTLMEILAKDVLVGRLSTKVDKMVSANICGITDPHPALLETSHIPQPSFLPFLLVLKEAYEIVG